MKFSHPAADIYVPDANLTPEAALARTTQFQGFTWAMDLTPLVSRWRTTR